MKLVLYDDYRPGVLRDDTVIDIADVVDVGRDGQETMLGIITDWEKAKPAIEGRVAKGGGAPLSGVRLRAPVPKPGKIICMAANYRENTDKPALPVDGFIVSPEAVMDPGGTTVLPPYDFSICHHEAELVAVIGKKGKNLGRADTMSHVFGYTAGVDVSARGLWGRLSKAFDGFKPLGPCIVTADEIGDPHRLQVRLSVDGQPRQDYNTADIGHPIDECLEWWTSITTILPGDLLFVGTNHQQLGPLQDGEMVEMGIDKIGSFQFFISDPKKRSWPKGIDPSVGQSVRSRLTEAASASKVN